MQNYIAQPVVLFHKGVELEIPSGIVKANEQRAVSLVRDQRVRFFNKAKIFNGNENRNKRIEIGAKTKKQDENKDKTDRFGNRDITHLLKVIL